MSEEETERESLLEVYQNAAFMLSCAQEDFEKALLKLQGIGIYPSPLRSARFRLPVERGGTEHKFEIGFGKGKIEGYLTAACYGDGTLGEIFIKSSKMGDFISGLLNVFAIVFSQALQHGVPLDRLVDKLKFTKFEPAGMTQHPQIRMATSVIDYLMRWLEDKFLEPKEDQ